MSRDILILTMYPSISKNGLLPFARLSCVVLGNRYGKISHLGSFCVFELSRMKVSELIQSIVAPHSTELCYKMWKSSFMFHLTWH